MSNDPHAEARRHMAAHPGRIEVHPFRQRFTTCASCRAEAVGRVWIDGNAGATTCSRHVNVWVRRAAADLAAVTR